MLNRYLCKNAESVDKGQYGFFFFQEHSHFRLQSVRTCAEYLPVTFRRTYRSHKGKLCLERQRDRSHWPKRSRRTHHLTSEDDIAFYFKLICLHMLISVNEVWLYHHQVIARGF